MIWKYIWLYERIFQVTQNFYFFLVSIQYLQTCFSFKLFYIFTINIKIDLRPLVVKLTLACWVESASEPEANKPCTQSQSQHEKVAIYCRSITNIVTNFSFFTSSIEKQRRATCKTEKEKKQNVATLFASS